MDFDLKRRSRVCSRTERELGPGEVYFSVLLEDQGEIVRQEICNAAWEGPPEGCISWWQARIPERDPNKFFWAPDDVIIDYFEAFLDDESKAIERYVLALLLIQKKIFRLEDTAADESGLETLFLACHRRDSEYQVRVVEPSPQQVEAVQDELVELLFSDEPFDTPEISEAEAGESDSPMAEPDPPSQP